MKLELTEDDKTEDAIFSSLFIDGIFECFTLENKALSITSGEYEVCITWSPKFKREMPLLIVPGRSGIRIHPANSPEELEGCIAPGVLRDGDAIGDSKLAFDRLFPLIENALNHKERVTIEVNRQ